MRTMGHVRGGNFDVLKSRRSVIEDCVEIQ